MLSVHEASARLGVSEARVRLLLKNKQLEGEKIGSTWIVSERSVIERVQGAPRRGRPAKEQELSYKRQLPDIEAAHRIYDEAARVLAGCYDASFLDQARSPEEQAFWICAADFFLQQRQRALVREGVY